MAKQVNLFTEDLLPGYGSVQLPYFIVSALIALLFAAGFVAYSVNIRQQLVLEQQQWQNNAERQALALSQYQQLNPTIQNIDNLAATNAELTTQLEQRRIIFKDLALQLEDSLDGYSPALQQLIDYDIDGLWLDNIYLAGGQNSFTLSGYARSPELIPSYISSLGQSSFQGINITQLSVTKTSPEQSLWQFSLSNVVSSQLQRSP